MKAANLNHLQSSKIVTIIYFVVAVILVFSELFKLHELLLVFKPLLIPSLAVLYYLTSAKKNLWYMSSLVFALASNIFLLSSTQEYIVAGILTYMIYRIISIFIIVRASEKLNWLPLVLATIPFLLIFFLISSLIEDLTLSKLYLSIINGLTISLMGGIALANYVMNDNKQNLWLLISTLFFVALTFLFIFQKYFIANFVFPPLSAILFSTAHYCFYKFMIESEKTTPE